MRRNFIFFIFLFFSIFSFAHLKEGDSYFLVEFARGALWDLRKTYNKQACVGKHILWLKKLYREGKIKYAFYDENKFEIQKVYFLYDNKSDLIHQMQNNSCLVKKVLKYKVSRVKLSMLKRSD